MSLATAVTATTSRIARGQSSASTGRTVPAGTPETMTTSTPNRRDRMSIQHLIDESPREHPPWPYEVGIWSGKGKKEKYEGIWHVRASSERRAKLTALREAMHYHTSVRAGSVTRIGVKNER